MTMLSTYFSLEECTRIDKRHGIDNTPTAQVIQNMTALCREILDPCREFLGSALGVHSVYRCKAYNTLIGGDPNSQHMSGQAADIDCDIYRIGNNTALFNFIREKLPFDILIWEFGTDIQPDWIHVSHRLPMYGVNRRMVKKAIKENGVTKYLIL